MTQPCDRRPPLRCLPAEIEPRSLENYTRALGDTSQVGLGALARAIAAGIDLPDFGDVALVIKEGKRSALGVLGRLKREDAEKVALQCGSLNDTLASLINLSYEQITTDCEILHEKLRRRFSADSLSSFAFLPLPRGGLIVLGILSYVLDLDKTQILAPGSVVEPDTVVIVDDCSLSGRRFAQTLEKSAFNNIVFAPLYAPAPLLAAIEQTESRVAICVCAKHLAGASGKSPPSRGQVPGLPGKRYWLGNTNHLCFPWGETDRFIINRPANTVHPGWPVVPSDLTLKRRPSSRTSPVSIQIQVNPNGPLYLHDDIIYGFDNGHVAITNITTGAQFGLDGVAVEIWRAVMTTGSRQQAVQRVLKHYDAGENQVRTDTDNLIETLISRGILQRHS